MAAFGYPKEEPVLRDGKWTQRFQAAIFIYVPENDNDEYVPGPTSLYRDFVVSLDNLGEQYAAAKKIKLK